MKADHAHFDNPRADFLLGGGEMGERVRDKDWAQTVLGSSETWPPSLKTSISIMLASRFAMVVAWGPEFRFFYNDRYRPVLGASKHPKALGTPAQETFPEAWPFIGPLFESTRRGESVALDDVLIPLDRNGYLENCYFTLSYSPIRDESGGVGGMLAVVAETTERVEGERRLKTLRELARRAADAKTPEQACKNAAATLGENPIDVPFALFYLVDSDGRKARRVCCAGITFDLDASPATLDLTDLNPRGWPLAEVAETRGARVVSDLPLRFGDLPGGPYPEAANTAVIAAVGRPGQPRPDAILIFGVSPRRGLDDSYRGFYDLAADHILTGIRNALAHQEERDRAEALAELDRAKTAFFNNVSHEFRTPLTLMLGPLEDALATPEALPGDARAHLEVAHRNSLRLLKLVNTLLDFSRIEAGRMQAVFEPVDLAAYTAELGSLFRSATDRAGLEFDVECPPVGEPVYIDREMWEKIVFNLLSNAFKFTFAGRIQVALRRTEANVELVVRDSGTGIPEEDIAHLFERFYRVKGARGRTYEGTGIGLALVRELARFHGGSIHVTSRLNEGSTFVVSIPLGRAHLSQERIGTSRAIASTALRGDVYIEEAISWLPQPPVDSAQAMEGKAGKAHVLLADDNADMRDYVVRLLSPRFRVTSSPDGQAALEAARREKPDVILSDIMMPRMDGLDLLRAVRSDPKLRPVPVILLSARAGEEARVEGLSTGADDYLVKPFSARELIARVETHLQMSKVLHESEERERARAEKLEALMAAQAAIAIDNARLYETAQKAKSEAELANCLKDEFLATVSHELRTPLNAVLGWARLLRAGRIDAQRQAQALEVIERNALAQEQIIEDILDVSGIITGKLRLEMGPIEAATVVEAAVDSMKPSADAKGVILEPLIDPGSNVVLGDANRIQQIIWNLVSNAVKFTPRGGRVQVVLQRLLDSYVEIGVHDTGKGIPKAFLPHVFERFRQADSSSTRQFGGLGLGLAIVRHLTELHGGTTHASSPGEGQGATFTIRLPLAMVHGKHDLPLRAEPRFHALEARNAVSEYAPRLDRIKVLAVDDENDARALLSFVLSQCQAEVRTAASVEEAVKLIMSWKPDVLISDIGMPGEDGYALIRKIRALPPERGGNIPAAALTAYARSEDRVKALSAGFQTHITKPVDPSELIAVVASLAGLTGKTVH